MAKAISEAVLGEFTKVIWPQSLYYHISRAYQEFSFFLWRFLLERRLMQRWPRITSCPTACCCNCRSWCGCHRGWSDRCCGATGTAEYGGWQEAELSCGPPPFISCPPGDAQFVVQRLFLLLWTAPVLRDRLTYAGNVLAPLPIYFPRCCRDDLTLSMPLPGSTFFLGLSFPAPRNPNLLTKHTWFSVLQYFASFSLSVLYPLSLSLPPPQPPPCKTLCSSSAKVCFFFPF